MLKTILPKEKIEEKIEEKIVFEEYRRNEIDKIAKLTPVTCSQVGMSIWNEIVQKQLIQVDPHAIAKYIDNEDPKLHMKIANIVKRKVVFEMVYCLGKLNHNNIKDNKVCEFFVAHIFPNTMYLADILLQNPKKPIAVNERKFEHQTHEGLGLLPLVMSNLENVSSKIGCNQISLTAAKLDQVPLFEKYGFYVQKSMAGELAMRVGMGVPMEKEIYKKK